MRGDGGIDNFIEAGKANRGEPHGKHKGYVFSNAWVHQTVESMCIALMVDPQGDVEIIKAQELMRGTLERWIPDHPCCADAGWLSANRLYPGRPEGLAGALVA